MRVFVIVSLMLAMLSVALVPACGPSENTEKAAETTGDGGNQDTANNDTTTDTGTQDTTTDNGTTDTGTPDSGTKDDTTQDTGTPDNGTQDTTPDTTTQDTPADAGPTDTPSGENTADATMDGGTPETTMETTPEMTADMAPTSNVPTSGTALFNWLKAGNYKNFPAESKVHTSNSAHGGGVRVFINTILDNSLKAGTKIHPKGAALIKELWTSDLKTLRGWAVQVKTDANSNNGQGWYWYEIFSTTNPAKPVVDGQGDTRDAALCVNCHKAGTDYMRTTYPLQ